MLSVFQSSRITHFTDIYQQLAAEDESLQCAEFMNVIKATIIGNFDYAVDVIKTYGGTSERRVYATVYKQAALAGHAEGMLQLAYFLSREDPQLAFSWCINAARLLHAPAQRALGRYYETGAICPLEKKPSYLVNADMPRMRYWYRAAAKNGDAYALFDLAEYEVNREAKLALYEEIMLQQQQQSGDKVPESNPLLLGIQFELGTCYLRDEPVDEDLGAALLIQAASLGHAEAIAALETHAGVVQVAKGCCIGCGQRERGKLFGCKGCHLARYCGRECSLRTWPAHKPHCKLWRCISQ